MSDATKGKLALYWAASCGGCEIAVLAINEKILDVAAAVRHRLLARRRRRQGPRRGEACPTASIDVCLFNGGIRTSEQEYMAQLLRAKVEGAGGLRLLRPRGLHSRAGQRRPTAAEIFDTVYHDTPSTENPERRRAAAQDRGARRHAAPAGVLRHAADARPDRAGRLLPARLPARGRADLGRDHGDRRGQAAAAGLGDRRRDDRLRRVPADAEREEDQEVLPHLGDHPRRRDVPAGAGPALLRDRHAGRLRRALPAGQLALHRLLRAERGRPRLRGADDDRPGLGDRLERPGGNRPDHPRRHPRPGGQLLPLQPGRQPAAAREGRRDRSSAE